LAIIQGAKFREASRIFAIDVNPAKFAMATQLGATDCINSSELAGTVQEFIVKQTTWGVDYSFDATGNVNVMRSALECSHRGELVLVSHSQLLHLLWKDGVSLAWWVWLPQATRSPPGPSNSSLAGYGRVLLSEASNPAHRY